MEPDSTTSTTQKKYQKKLPPYTGETRIKKGLYAGKKLYELSDEYLLEIRECSLRVFKDARLYSYIQERLRTGDIKKETHKEQKNIREKENFPILFFKNCNPVEHFSPEKEYFFETANHCACGKEIHATSKLALIKISEINRRAKMPIEHMKGFQKKRKLPFRAYFCEVCHGWHLSSVSRDRACRRKEKVEKIINPM